MSEANDPLRTERAQRSDGLVVARQAPPASAASFSATYLGPAGWGYDPGGRLGIARVTSHLVTSGAGQRDRIALARELDLRGATIRTRCHPESAEVTLWGPMDSFEPLLALLADVVRAPRLSNPDLDRVRRQAIEQQLRDASQPDRRAERELYRAIFPAGHPYRLSGLGTRFSVAGIRREDVVRFHREHYTAEGGIVAVTAALPLDEVRRAVDRAFPTFARAKAPETPPIPSASRGGALRRTVDMPGRAQVEVRIGGESVSRRSEWYPAAFLANEILGGRPLLGRLFQRVRERHGLAYHASSELEAMRWGGYWSVQAGTGPERVDRVLPLLQRELERLRSDPVPSAELEAVRESIIGEIPLSLESTSGAHELLLDIAYHDLPGDFYRTWPQRLRTLSAAEVRRGAEEGLGGERQCTVVAGPPSAPASERGGQPG
jgi:zinc protease